MYFLRVQRGSVGCSVAQSGCSVTQSGCSVVQSGCSVAQLGCSVQRGALAGPSSNLGSAPHGGSAHWAYSCEDMEMGLSECLWMNVWCLNISNVQKKNKCKKSGIRPPNLYFFGVTLCFSLIPGIIKIIHIFLTKSLLWVKKSSYKLTPPPPLSTRCQKALAYIIQLA